jgi:hypothetical protein
MHGGCDLGVWKFWFGVFVLLEVLNVLRGLYVQVVEMMEKKEIIFK